MSQAGPRTGPLDLAQVVELLAAFGDRAPESVDDVVGSLELTWLIAQVEQRYAVVLDLSDEDLARIATVADAADVLCAALVAAGVPDGATADADAGAQADAPTVAAGAGPGTAVPATESH